MKVEKRMKLSTSFWISAVFFVLPFCELALGQKCVATATYIKRNYFRPNRFSQDVLLNSSRPGITVPCLERCSNLSLSDCPAILMDYDASSCFRVNSQSYDQNTIFELGSAPSGNVNYFQKACLQVPRNCSAQLWALETTVGFELVSHARKVVNNTADAVACGQLCLSEASFGCLSAGFYAAVAGKPNGTCVLSAEDRRTRPDSYRASFSDVVYLENQCHSEPSSCPMNEYLNNALGSFTEIGIDNITDPAECERQCLASSQFICRGFDFGPPSSSGSRCRLHGDDTSSLGAGVLSVAPNSVYRERVDCLDLSVTCSSLELSITLVTAFPFTGRVFAVGFSEECNVDGAGANETTLVLQLDTGFPSQQCGVVVERPQGVRDRFRTVTAVVQIQYNAIIQRLGDRVVRVSCHLGDNTLPDLTLEKNISFAVDGSSGVVNITVNSTTVLPNVRLRIVDLSSGLEDSNQTIVGQPLQIRIENVPPDGLYDVMPTLLTASNEDGSQSFLLLDGRGCPANTDYFPVFERDGNGTYAANFKAFRFVNSLVVKFKLMVHLCENTCAQANCNGSVGVFRNRRAWSSQDNIGLEDPEAIPLEVNLQVLPSSHLEPVILARSVEDAVVVLKPAVDAADAYFCMPNDTALGVLIGWIILQVIILLLCACLVRCQLDRQDKQLEESLKEDLLDFDNNRFRGHWSQNVDIAAPADEIAPISSRHHDLGRPDQRRETPYL